MSNEKNNIPDNKEKSDLVDSASSIVQIDDSELPQSVKDLFKKPEPDINCDDLD